MSEDSKSFFRFVISSISLVWFFWFLSYSIMQSVDTEKRAKIACEEMGSGYFVEKHLNYDGDNVYYRCSSLVFDTWSYAEMIQTLKR